MSLETISPAGGWSTTESAPYGPVTRAAPPTGAENHNDDDANHQLHSLIQPKKKKREKGGENTRDDTRPTAATAANPSEPGSAFP